MNIPPETMEVIQKIMNRLAPKFTFGHYGVDDIKQEIFLLAVEGLDKYDSTRGAVSTYLYYYVYSRIKNFKRNKFHRKEYQCSKCNCTDPNCDKCIKRRWNTERKIDLLEAKEAQYIADDSRLIEHHDYLEDLAIKELQGMINQELPVSMRENYLRMIDGLYVQKSKRDEIETFLHGIIDKWQMKKAKEDR